MKNIYVVLLILVMLALPGFAQASPFYLTLEGTVDSISDSGGLASSANIGVGAKVQYVVEVDLDRVGTTTHWNGKTKDKRGTVFSALNAGVLSGRTMTGSNYLNSYWEGFYAQTGNDKSVLQINNWNSDLASLVVGSKVNQLYELSYNNIGQLTQLGMKDLTVTNISNVAPTPIPGAALIMLGGLGVVGFIKRRFA